VFSRHQRIVGTLWVILSATGFGAMAIFAKLAYGDGVDLPTMLFLRFLIAGVLMTLFMRATRVCWPRGRTLVALMVMGAVGYVGQSFCYFAALQFSSAALTALLLYLYPALVTLLVALRQRKALSPDRLLAVGVALGGTALTVGDSLTGSLAGVLLGVAAAVIYSVYIVVGQDVTRRAGSIPASTVIMLSAAVVYGGIASAQGLAMPASAPGWGAVLAIAVLSTALAIVGFFKGMEKLGATDAATLSTLEPVVTVVLAGLVLGESIGGLQLLGGTLILATVVYLARRPAL
jgi:drug/metabolite transporter (DMT)-like permease